ncbi:MAG: tetratricopeptide repeat protein [Candidatus Omnitrophota bacterium]
MLRYLKKSSYVFIFLAVCLFLPALLPAKELPLLLERSRYYRKQGFEFQSQGRLDEAMACYHKAIILDPTYTAAYNDLGIVYEAVGMDDKAEEAYLAGLKTDPNYPNLYTNLAMLYEKNKEYVSAARFWKKRIELGPPGDVWVKKAQERLVALREFVPELKQEYLKAQAAELAEELAVKRREERLKELAEINRLYNEAKNLYQSGEYEKALNSVNLALNLNPTNKEELLSFRDEVEKKARIAKINGLVNEAKRLYQNAEYAKAIDLLDLVLDLNPENRQELLSLREEIRKRARIAEMENYFQNAMGYYQKDDLQEAKRELEKISAEITSSLKDN